MQTNAVIRRVIVRSFDENRTQSCSAFSPVLVNESQQNAQPKLNVETHLRATAMAESR